MLTTPTTGMEAILDQVPTLTTLVSKVFDLMTANPLLTTILAASLIGLGIRVFSGIKRSARK